MKKAILAFSVVAVSLAACNGDTAKETKTDSSANTTTPPATVVDTAKKDTAAVKVDTAAKKVETKVDTAAKKK